MPKETIDYIGHVRINDDGKIVDFAVCESAKSLDMLLKALKDKPSKAKKVIRFKGDDKLGIALKEALEKAIKQQRAK